jgi:hypothetical protein
MCIPISFSDAKDSRGSGSLSGCKGGLAQIISLSFGIFSSRTDLGSSHESVSFLVEIPTSIFTIVGKREGLVIGLGVDLLDDLRKD